MTLRELFATTSAIFIIVGAIWYIYCSLWGNKVKPVLASWIIIAGTMTLSFATYWTSPRHNIISNAANAASVIAALSILIALFYLHIYKHGAIRFSKFQKWSLLISGIIALFWVTLVWVFHGTGIVPNILTQVLMIVGYIVTIQKFWRSTENTESMVLWSCITLGCGIALYTGIVSGDFLAILYASRATLSAATVVWLMCRIERRNRFVMQQPVPHNNELFQVSSSSMHQQWCRGVLFCAFIH